MIAEVALLICIVIFCKIMSWPLKWELSIFSPFQISSLHRGTKIFWHCIFWQPIFEFIPKNVLLPKVIYNNCQMWRNIRALFFIFCQIFRKLVWKGICWSLCFGGDFTNQIYFIWGISDSKQLSNLSIKMVLAWDADTIIWNFLIIRGINISVALLSISPGNSMVFLYNTLGISPGVSTSLRSYSLSWRFFIRWTWCPVS